MKESQIPRMKKCEMCLEEKMLKLKEKFCAGCKRVRNKKFQLDYDERNKATRHLKKRKMYEDNFNKMKLESVDLIPKNFDMISDLSSLSYRMHYKLNWKEVLEVFNKDYTLKEYITEKYKEFYENTGSRDMVKFADTINMRYGLIQEFDIEDIMSSVGLKIFRYTDKELEENMLNIYNLFGRIPLYSEFMKHTKISIPTYRAKFNTKGGKAYSVIIKNYFTSEQLDEYNLIRMDHKSEVGRENHQGLKYSDKELESNFRTVFDDYMLQIGEYPTSRIFNKLSKIDESIYRHRTNHELSFLGVARMYGYPIEDYGSTTEKYVIETYSSILKDNAVTQKTFSWLKSPRNYNLKCDGYFERCNLIIEYDGEQHSRPVDWANKGEEWALESFKNVQIHDAIKNNLIPKHGLTLIRIGYDEPYWDEDFLRMRLHEHGIKVPNRNIISDSINNINKKKIS